MSVHIKYLVAALLFMSFLLLSILVPGGPIETRNFAHIDPLILGAFNTFLTFLAITSLAVIYFIMKSMEWAYALSLICGVSYSLIYTLDLASIFPLSPDSMPHALFVIEILGTIIAIPLIYFSLQGLSKSENKNTEQVLAAPVVHSKLFAFVVLTLAMIGIGVITFATKSAMGD